VSDSAPAAAFQPFKRSASEQGASNLLFSSLFSHGERHSSSRASTSTRYAYASCTTCSLRLIKTSRGSSRLRDKVS
jgi:hypothetical protein